MGKKDYFSLASIFAVLATGFFVTGGIFLDSYYNSIYVAQTQRVYASEHINDNETLRLYKNNMEDFVKQSWRSSFLSALFMIFGVIFLAFTFIFMYKGYKPENKR